MKIVRTDRSRIEQYQRCPRSRYLAYHQNGMGIQSATTPLPLCVGASIHEGLAELLRGKDEDTAVRTALSHFSQYHSQLELDTTEQAAWQHQVAIPDDQFREQLAASTGVSVEDAGLAMLQQNVAQAKQQFDDYLWQEQSAVVEGIIRAYARRKLRPLLEKYEVFEVEREGEWELARWQALDPKFPWSGTDQQWEIKFMSRPDALLCDRSDNSLYILSFKTAAAWDIRKARDAQHDMQGLSEGVEVERRLGEWWRFIRERQQFENVVVGTYHVPVWSLPQHPDAPENWDRMGPWLGQLSAPPRILGIRYEYLLKGERWKDKELSAKLGFECRSQRSILTRAYQSSKGAELNCEWDFIKEDGSTGKLAWQNWRSRPLWELGISVRQWIDMLDDSTETMSAYDSTVGIEPRALGWKSRAQATGFLSQHPLDSVFVPPMVIYRQDEELRDWIEQIEHQERRIAEVAAQVESVSDEGERRSLLNQHFPMVRRACEYPTTCQFCRICYSGDEMKRDPLSSGLYRERVPNHPMEILEGGAE